MLAQLLIAIACLVLVLNQGTLCCDCAPSYVGSDVWRFVWNSEWFCHYFFWPRGSEIVANGKREVLHGYGRSVLNHASTNT